MLQQGQNNSSSIKKSVKKETIDVLKLSVVDFKGCDSNQLRYKLDFLDKLKIDSEYIL